MVEILYFFRPVGPYGWLSNFSPHCIVENGILFKTMEHYFMYHKARAHGDELRMGLILECDTPTSAKRHGRLVKNYDDKLWSSIREDVMYTGLKLKVEQYLDVRLRLMNTGNQILAEANPFDRIWGIGLSAVKAAGTDKPWPGKNLLGKIWMRVRDEL